MSAQGASPPPRRPAFGSDLRKADAQWLVLLPIGAALLFGVLLLPWSAHPSGVPLPVPDAAALVRAADADRALAEHAREQPLAGPVRALGSALRAYHTLEAKHAADLAQPGGAAGEQGLGDARAAVDAELPSAFHEGDDALVALRAVELEAFLAETRRFEQTGTVSPELEALAGTFVPSMVNQGWCQGHTLAASPAVLRVMFKEMWNSFVGVQGRPAFEPTLDELRALFAFYLGHPHPLASARDTIDAMRRGARDARDCAAADALERRSTERWRLQRIDRIAAVDPAYPAEFARGVASYGAGDHEGAAAAFRTWLQEHPEGPYTLRAEAFLRASLAASRLD